MGLFCLSCCLSSSYNNTYLPIVLRSVLPIPSYSTRYDETCQGNDTLYEDSAYNPYAFPLIQTTAVPLFYDEKGNAGNDKKWAYHPNAINPGRDIDIMDERLMELACEGCRFWDLVRWGIAEGQIEGHPFADGFMSDFVPGKNEFFPLPESGIIRSFTGN